jgi:hypothetical protein
LTLTNEEVVELIDNYDKEAKAIREDLIQICWYMRGSISYEEAFFLTPEEKGIISKLIKDNMEAVEKTGLPFI